MRFWGGTQLVLLVLAVAAQVSGGDRAGSPQNVLERWLWPSLWRKTATPSPGLLSAVQPSTASVCGSSTAATMGPSSCTPPRPITAVKQPFCVQPSAASAEARAYLAAHAVDFGPAEWTASNAAAARAASDSAWEAKSAAVLAAHMMPNVVETQLGGAKAFVAVPKSGVNASSNDSAVVLYLHGGGYVTGACSSRWQVIAPIAGTAHLRAVCLEYSLAPEHPYPAALEEALAAYRALLQQQGHLGSSSTSPRNAGAGDGDGAGGNDPAAAASSRRVAIAGDSAGGGLALALVQAVAAADLPPPGALLLMWPWADLSNTSDTLATLSGVDPVLHYEGKLEPSARAYAGAGVPLTHPGVSPLYGRFAAPWPPTLLQVGLRDSLLSDATRLYRLLSRAGLPVTFSPWEGMWHGFIASSDAPEAIEAAAEAAAFLRTHLAT